MPRANWGVMARWPVALPPHDLVAEFDRLVRDTVEQIQVLVFKNRVLRQARDLLLPKLISGQVDLSELDIQTEVLEE
jgi:type I restriction enzyme S subunit